MTAGVVAAQDLTPNSVTGKVVWSANSSAAVGISVQVTCNAITKTAVTNAAPPAQQGRFNTGDVPGWNEGDAFTIVIPSYAIVSGTTSGTLSGTTTDVGNLSISPNQPPVVTVTYPNGGEEIIFGTQVVVSASVTDDNGVDNVTFYYSANNGTTWNLIGVVETPTSGNTTNGIWSRTWDTPDLCEDVGAEYLIKAAANDGFVVSEDQSESTFSLVDRTKPIVANASATPATILNNTEFTEFRVDVADPCGLIDNVTINLSAIGWEPEQEMEPPVTITTMFCIGNYSSNGLLWTTYNYTTNASIAGTFYLTVNATDNHGNYNDSVSIMLNVSEAAGEFSIDLQAGLNLVSIPLIPETLNNLPVWNGTGYEPVENPIITCSLADYNITKIWRYTPGVGYGYSLDYLGEYGDNGWYSDDQTFKGIEPDRGYFFVVKPGGAFAWTFTGAFPMEPSAVNLVEGLNLVGMTSIDETRGLLPVWNGTGYEPVENPIINCSLSDYKITKIWRYTPGVGFGYSLDYLGEYGDNGWYSDDPTFKGLEPGRGYFFVVKPGGAFTWEYEP
jgi:hypothetical protein